MPFPESQKHVSPKHSLVGVTQIALTLTLSCIKYDLQHLSDKYAAVSQDARASHLSSYHPVSSGYHIPAPPLCFLSVQLRKAAAPLLHHWACCRLPWEAWGPRAARRCAWNWKGRDNGVLSDSTSHFLAWQQKQPADALISSRTRCEKYLHSCLPVVISQGLNI